MANLILHACIYFPQSFLWLQSYCLNLNFVNWNVHMAYILNLCVLHDYTAWQAGRAVSLCILHDLMYFPVIDHLIYTNCIAWNPMGQVGRTPWWLFTYISNFYLNGAQILLINCLCLKNDLLCQKISIFPSSLDLRND